MKCEECHDGTYVIRSSGYSNFAGCSNYPKCKATLTIPEYVKKVLEQDGVNIYKWKKQCPKCKKETSVISYYLNYDLEKYDDVFEMVENIGIGDIPFIDKILVEKYKNVKWVTHKFQSEKYVANVCEHCGHLQGHYYVVEDPHEILEELFYEKTMEKYLFDHINVKGIFMPYKELNILG